MCAVFEENAAAVLFAAAATIEAGRVGANQLVTLTRKEVLDPEFR